MKAGGIYARYSPGRDRDQSSTIEAQVSMCQEKARAEGVTIDEGHIYVDRGVSGGTIARGGFMRMLASIRSGVFPSVLYAKDDKRLFRNEREAGELIEEIWSSGVEIRYCLVEFGDPRSSDEQWFLQRSFHIFAELERRRKRKEVWEHQKQNALAGYSNGGMPPYGYRRQVVEVVDGAGVKKPKLSWEVDEREAPGVRLAFELRAAGKGFKVIADELTRQGFRSRRGGPMNKATIGEWFRNPHVFAGCIVWNTRDHRLKGKPRSEWVIVCASHPPIISMEMAHAMADDAEGRRMGKRVGMGKYLLSGLLVCSECDAKFVVNGTVKRKHWYYVCGSRSRRRDGCSNRVSLERFHLEELIMGDVRQMILSPGVVEAYLERVRAETADGNQEAELKRLRVELGRIEGRIEELVDALADRELPREVVRRKIKEENERKRTVEADIGRYEVALDGFGVDLTDFRERLREALSEDEEMKKAALDSLIRRVVVYPDAALEIEYQLPVRIEADSATTLVHRCEYAPGRLQAAP